MTSSAANSARIFDETGSRVAGRLHWVRSAPADKYRLVYVHPNRAAEP